MPTIAFTVMGTPTGKGRPRATVRGGYAAVYTDAKTRDAEQSFLAQALPYKPAEPLDGPLRVEIQAYCSVPRSWSKKRRQLAIAGTVMPTGKPDVDNLAKLVLDAMNGVFFLDDKQVISLTVSKAYDNVPRVEVRIEPLR